MSLSRDEQLEQALARAMVAAARLEVFAQKAHAEGHPREAALFAALAASAQVHARRFTLLLRGKVAGTEANLAETAGELLPGLEQDYAAWASNDQDGNAVAGSALDQTTQATARQAELAKDLERGQGSGAAYLLCPVCGWLARGEAPDNCPVCGCIAAKFQTMGLPD